MAVVEEWLRIGEVARRTGLTLRTLRHYDDLGLLVPSGRSSGDYRLYSGDDLRRLLAIQHLKSLGLSLDEVGAALDDPSFDASDVLARHIAVVQARLAAEQELLARLTALRDAAGSGWEDVLAVVALTERLRHPEAWVRFRAALESPASAPLDVLVEGLRSDPEPGVREALTWGVVHHGEAAVPAVLAHLDDPDPGVRTQMAHVLGKLAHPATAAALAGLLVDPEPAVQAKAAFALGQVGTAEALSALSGALGSDDPLVADAVASALDRIGPAAVPVVVERLRAPEPLVREHAAETLGYLGDAAAVPALADALRDTHAPVRLAAAIALGAIGTDAARTALAVRADDADARVRAVVRRLLA